MDGDQLEVLGAGAVENGTEPSATSSAHHHSLRVAAGPPPPPPAQPWDMLIYSAFWPPTAVPVDAHSRARHIIHMKQAYAGFWTHGLWPSK
jgi:ribonuclease I